MANFGRKLMVAAVAVLGAWAAPASAGTYTVMSCKDRAGARLALDDGSGGWRAGSTGGLGLDAVDSCDDAAHGMQAAVSGTTTRPIGSSVWWRFVPPPHTLIEGADLLYSAYARPWNGQNRGSTMIQAPDAGYLASDFGMGGVTPTWVHQHGLHEPWIQVTASCDGAGGDCAAGAVHAWIQLLRSEVTLSDESPPEAGAATGSAVASSRWEGTHVFAFPASDEGGGIYEATLSVDGTLALARTIDDRGGRCADTTAGARVFAFPQPCPTAVDALVAVDSNALPAGEHDVVLRVVDAAGNVRTIYAARKTIVPTARRIGPGSDPATRGAANGENASDDARLAIRWARTGHRSLTAPYGRRNVIRGRLVTAAGAGIRGARVELLAAIDGRARALRDDGGTRTRRDGRFTLILPADVSSRTLVLRYRSHANDTVSVAEGTLRLSVRAGVRLRVTPRTAARGRTVRISGRLVGRPLPLKGKVVELQARSPGAPWITFRTIRASRRGRFATRYTFHRGGPAVYLMRARVRAADDYPYATGSSHAVRVDVR
jgi:hypothetical protein